MTVPRKYYLNALFDLQLGGFPTLPVQRGAAEMTTLFVPLLKHDDYAVLDVAVPDDYLAGLREYGLGAGEAGETGGSGNLPVVWGWNQSAIKRMAPVPQDAHPPLEIVRKVNGRRFGSELAGRLGIGVPGTVYCSTLPQVENAVCGKPARFPLVIKPAFGGSGYGFRMLQSERQWERERNGIEGFCRNGGVTVEPWLDRKYDMSMSMEIEPDGGIGQYSFQRQWVNRFGAYCGSYCADDDPLISPWKKQLEHAGGAIAAVMAAEGYFGPVGIDSFVYTAENGSEKLAAAIEINARYTMGMLTRQLREALCIRSPVVMRSIGKKRCILPETPGKWNALMGELTYSVIKKSGILPITPLRVGYAGRWQQPQRTFFLIAGDSEQDILNVDRTLRNRIQSLRAHRE